MVHLVTMTTMILESSYTNKPLTLKTAPTFYYYIATRQPHSKIYYYKMRIQRNKFKRTFQKDSITGQLLKRSSKPQICIRKPQFI